MSPSSIVELYAYQKSILILDHLLIPIRLIRNLDKKLWYVPLARVECILDRPLLVLALHQLQRQRIVKHIILSCRSDDEATAAEYYGAKASKKKEKKRQEREARRQAEEAARESRLTKQDHYAEMRRRKDEEREAEERRLRKPKLRKPGRRKLLH
ncbi:hypothetical protein K1719_034988 [Acacia pycnantha]|nr:hypothetical protein K1719_038882 [Acacia pycnantha]KAI9083084.1 hypothetical protein K1719_034988 [Acacia pycnantha]